MAFPKKAAAAPKPPASGGSVNFGAPEFYSSAGDLIIPEGNYALEFQTQNFQPTKRDGSNSGAAFLAVVARCHSLDNPELQGDNALEQVWSMGPKAAKSFVPSEDGLGLEPIAGADASATASEASNWGQMMKSLYDCGLPAGVFTGSLAPLQGIHVHLHHMAEPESRKGFSQAVTGEAADQKKQYPRKIAVVSEILAMPWEGAGGIPDGTAVAKPASNGKPPAARAAAPAPVAATAPAGAMDEADVEAAVSSGVATVLEKNVNGCVKLAMRTQAFTAIQKEFGDETAQAVKDYLQNDEYLDAVLGKMGYKIAGPKIVAAS